MTKLDEQITRLANRGQSVSITVSIYPQKKRKTYRGLPGHIISIASAFPLDLEVDNQFMGVHKCMCLTLRKPAKVTNLIEISRELPSVAPFGNIIWLGRVHMYQLKTSIKGYIPPLVWSPSGTEFSGILRCMGIVHPVRKGMDKFEYYLLEIPAIQRDQIVPAYLR